MKTIIGGVEYDIHWKDAVTQVDEGNEPPLRPCPSCKKVYYGCEPDTKGCKMSFYCRKCNLSY